MALQQKKLYHQIPTNTTGPPVFDTIGAYHEMVRPSMLKQSVNQQQLTTESQLSAQPQLSAQSQLSAQPQLSSQLQVSAVENFINRSRKNIKINRY